VSLPENSIPPRSIFREHLPANLDIHCLIEAIPQSFKNQRVFRHLHIRCHSVVLTLSLGRENRGQQILRAHSLDGGGDPLSPAKRNSASERVKVQRQRVYEKRRGRIACTRTSSSLCDLRNTNRSLNGNDAEGQARG